MRFSLKDGFILFSFFIVISYFGVVAYLYGFGVFTNSYTHLSCDRPYLCENPFYSCDFGEDCESIRSFCVVNPDLCAFQFIPANGFIGEKPPFLVEFAPNLLWFVFFMMCLESFLTYRSSLRSSQ